MPGNREEVPEKLLRIEFGHIESEESFEYHKRRVFHGIRKSHKDQ